MKSKADRVSAQSWNRGIGVGAVLLVIVGVVVGWMVLDRNQNPTPPSGPVTIVAEPGPNSSSALKETVPNSSTPPGPPPPGMAWIPEENFRWVVQLKVKRCAVCQVPHVMRYQFIALMLMAFGWIRLNSQMKSLKNS